jgi:hypothetical protein
MSLASTSAMAGILPTLLIAGLIGPVFGTAQIPRPERLLFAFQVLWVIFAEALCLWAIAHDQPLWQGFQGVVWFAAFSALLAILIYPIQWLRRTEEDTAAIAAARVKRAERKLNWKR